MFIGYLFAFKPFFCTKLLFFPFIHNISSFLYLGNSIFGHGNRIFNSKTSKGETFTIFYKEAFAVNKDIRLNIYIITKRNNKVL